MTDNHKAAVTLRLPPETVQRVKEMAEAEDRTTSAFLRRLISRALEAQNVDRTALQAAADPVHQPDAEAR